MSTFLSSLRRGLTNPERIPKTLLGVAASCNLAVRCFLRAHPRRIAVSTSFLIGTTIKRWNKVLAAHLFALHHTRAAHRTLNPAVAQAHCVTTSHGFTVDAAVRTDFHIARADGSTVVSATLSAFRLARIRRSAAQRTVGPATGVAEIPSGAGSITRRAPTVDRAFSKLPIASGLAVRGAFTGYRAEFAATFTGAGFPWLATWAIGRTFAAASAKERCSQEPQQEKPNSLFSHAVGLPQKTGPLHGRSESPHAWAGFAWPFLGGIGAQGSRRFQLEAPE